MIRRSKTYSRHAQFGTIEPLEHRHLLAAHSGSDWHNVDYPTDVNADGEISGRDALLVINVLNKNGAHALLERAEGELGSANSALSYIDVTGDNYLSARDALQVINDLTSEGEHEPGHVAGGDQNDLPDHELTDHIHAQLDIYINGDLVILPQDIGIDDSGIVAIEHTHAADNRIHVHPIESATPTEFTTLGDFFDTWRTNGGNAGNNPDAVFNENEILGNVADSEHSVRMFVNGVENSQFENYQFRDEDRIIILYEEIADSGSPIVLPVGEQIDLLSGSPLNLPLQGFDREDQNLTYTVSVDSDLVDARILEGNRSVRLRIMEGNRLSPRDDQFFGELSFQLFEQRVPRITEKIIEFVEDGQYEEAEFYSIVDLDEAEGAGLIALGGQDGARLFFPAVDVFDDQFHFELQHNAPGLVSSASTLDDENRVEFFVTAEPFRGLDFDNSVYGVVTIGENIRRRIMNSTTNDNNVPEGGLFFESAEIFEDNTNAVMVLQAAEGASGTANVTVTVTDEDGVSFDRTYAVSVTPDEVNGLPFLDPIENIVVRQGDPIQIQMTANDVEGDPVFFDAAPSPEGETDFDVQVDRNTGLITIVPPADFLGTLEVDAVVRGDMEPIQLGPADPLGPQDRARDRMQDRDRFSIEIIEPFQAVDDSYQVEEDSGETVLRPFENDNNVFESELRIVQTPQNGTATVSADGQQIEYRPNDDFFGQDTFSYTVAEDLDGASAGTVVVDVEGRNDPPTANDDTPTVARGAMSVTIDVLGNDTVAPDRDETLTITGTGNTDQGGTVEISGDGSSLIYSPVADFTGTETFTYTINDGTVDSVSTATVTVEVTGFLAVNDLYEIEEDSGPHTFSPFENDSDVMDSGLRIVDQPTNGTVNVSGDGRQIMYRPNDDFFGEDTFTYTIQDDLDGTLAGTIVVDVQGVNDLPTANDDTATVERGATGEIIDVLNDDTFAPDRDETLTITQVGNTDQGGTVEISDDRQSLIYSPAADFVGTETFTYTINDGTVGSDSTATVTVDVTNFVPITVSGHIYIDTNHNGERDESELAMGGVTVTLTGSTSDGNEIELSTNTLADGSYAVTDVPPGDYIVTTGRPFTQIGTVSVGPHGGTVDGKQIRLVIDGAVTELDQNNFGANGISPQFAFWYALATAPNHQALLAVSPDAGMEWFILDSSWGDAQLQSVEYSDDQTELIFRAIDQNGVSVSATIPASGDPRIRVIGEEAGVHLIQLLGTFSQLQFAETPAA